MISRQRGTFKLQRLASGGSACRFPRCRVFKHHSFQEQQRDIPWPAESHQRSPAHLSCHYSLPAPEAFSDGRCASGWLYGDLFLFLLDVSLPKLAVPFLWLGLLDEELRPTESRQNALLFSWLDESREGYNGGILEYSLVGALTSCRRNPEDMAKEWVLIVSIGNGVFLW